MPKDFKAISDQFEFVSGVYNYIKISAQSQPIVSHHKQHLSYK